MPASQERQQRQHILDRLESGVTKYSILRGDPGIVLSQTLKPTKDSSPAKGQERNQYSKIS